MTSASDLSGATARLVGGPMMVLVSGSEATIFGCSRFLLLHDYDLVLAGRVNAGLPASSQCSLLSSPTTKIAPGRRRKFRKRRKQLRPARRNLPA